MKKILTLILSTSIILGSCTSKNVSFIEPKVEPIFSQETKDFGHLVSNILEKTAKDSKKTPKGLQNKMSVQTLAKQNTIETFKKEGFLSSKKGAQLKSSLIETEIDTQTLSDIINSENPDLTKEQIKVLIAIETAIHRSSSYYEFSNKLATINNNLTSYGLSESERSTMEATIATMYFGLESINTLVNDNIISGTPETDDITLAQLKFNFKLATANAFTEDDDESWWDSWGKCAASVISGTLTGGLQGCGVGGAVGGTVGAGVGSLAGGVGAVPGAGAGAAAGCVAGGTIGAIAGGLDAAANSEACNDDD